MARQYVGGLWCRRFNLPRVRCALYTLSRPPSRRRSLSICRYRSALSRARRCRAAPGSRADRRRGAEAMGGEGMPQRMRRGAVGQAERAAQPLHGELDDARAESSPPRAPTNIGPVGRADAGTIAT